MSNHMIRWIEDAEARTYTEAARFEQSVDVTESRYARLGETIAKIPVWLRHPLDRSAH